MKAIILAAGKGLRLRPLTEKTPKPLIEIAGKSLLEHVFNVMPDSVREVTIVAGYLGDQIQQKIGTQYKDIAVSYKIQEELNGTGGALALCESEIIGPTLVMNADDLYLKKDIEALIRYECAVLVIESPRANPYPILIEEGRVLGFGEATKEGIMSYKNTGAYVIDPTYFEVAPVAVPVRAGSEYSLPHTLLTTAQMRPIQAIQATMWQPVGTIEELEFARKMTWR